MSESKEPKAAEAAENPASPTAASGGTEPTMPATPTDLSKTTLYVRYDEGQGPIIVYLHGINSDATDWRKVIDFIGPQYRHIAVDLLGFGESPKPLDVDYSADDHALTVDNTLRKLGVDQPFLLVGYSLGGDIAIRYASTYPEKLRRLFLLSAPFYLPIQEYDPQGLGPKYLMQMILQWAWRFVGGAKKHNDFLYQLADGKMQEAAKQFLRTDDVPKHWDIMSKNLQNCVANATFVDDLPKLTMPVTFALGVRDVIVQPDQTPALKRLKPEMEIRRIVGLNADHFMLAAIPDRVAEEIMRDEITSLHIAIHEGSGDPILLLHGLNGVGKSWKPVADALAKDHEVVALDLLGFGDSLHSETLLYTLQDHAIGVRNTMCRLWGDKPVTIVGQTLGANVALQVAADEPERVNRVVAIAAPIVPPDYDWSHLHIDSKEGARLFAAQEALDDLADNNQDRIASDRFVRRVLPISQSFRNAILRVDGAKLLDSQVKPVRFVAPTHAASQPDAFLCGEIEKRSDIFELDTIEGPENLAWERPRDTVQAIVPDDARAAEAAPVQMPPTKRIAGEYLVEASRSIENQLLLRGGIELILGLFVLSLTTLPRNLLTIGFAIWVVYEGIYSIVGSIGLRREKKGWLPYFLIGVLVVLAGGFLLMNRDASLTIVGLVIAVRALWVGIANIIVARAAGLRRTPKPTWVIWVQGFLGIAVGLSIVFIPTVGARLLKWVVGGYLTIEGVLLIAAAWQSKAAARKDAKQLMGDARIKTSTDERTVPV